MRELLKKIDNKLYFFVPNIEAVELIELFLITSIATIIGIRTLLILTGYPQIGTDELHFAHMLWGGMFMLLAILVILFFLNKEAKFVGAILGGIGFGAFIDELGKFITHDNDYFYRPTFAIIYIIFIILFLVFKMISSHVKLKSKDYAINALEIVKEIILHDLDSLERQKAMILINKADKRNPATKAIYNLIMASATNEKGQISFFNKTKQNLRKIYTRLVTIKDFDLYLSSLFVIIAIVNTFIALIEHGYYSPFISTGHIVSVIASTAFIFAGLYYMKNRKRLFAYQMFTYSILILIFITQLFYFYKHQFWGSISLFVNISVYYALKFLTTQETTISSTGETDILEDVENFINNEL